MAELPKPPDRVVTPGEFPAYEGRLKLRCQACGKVASYAVGRIMIDPEQLQNDAQKKTPHYEDMICFSGYFHCRNCGAGGPWEFPQTTVAQLQVLMILAIQNPKAVPGVLFLRPQLFDGTFTRTATEGEAYLQKLIEANPTDYFLWSRLGNLYDHAEQDDLASAAFERAIALNPADAESHYSLGCFAMEKKNLTQAAEHFHQVLRHCRTALPHSRQPGLVQKMVRDALERLWDLSQDSKGAIQFLPPFNPPVEATKESAPRHLAVKELELDLEEEKTWEALTAMYLTGRFPEALQPRTPPPRFPPPSRLPLAGSTNRVGRNQPCPCGSGKKFKQCCGRSR